MFNWEELTKIDLFYFSFGYILIRALIFYSLFMVLYQILNNKKCICKDLPSKHQIHVEIISNIKANVFEMIMIFVLLISGLTNYHANTSGNFLAGFFFCYLFFEVWFYLSHRLLHTKKIRKWHSTHHVSIITTPLSALTLDIKEKLLNDIGLLIIPMAMTYFLPLAIEGILAYHLYNFYVNVMGHSNLELMPKWFVHSPLGKVFTTATYHSIHHLKGDYNYGLFTTLCDRLFGTYDSHYLNIYDTVTSTNPKTRKDIIHLQRA